MNASSNKHISKLLSLALRHKPEALGIELDGEGWAYVDTILLRMQQKGLKIDLPKLQEIVAQNDKQRFSFNATGTKIRANQGHSIPVDLNLMPLAPPPVLYHGTARQNLQSILKDGLQRRSRQYVHLSSDSDTALRVGQRHGTPVILIVQSAALHQAGYHFYQSVNGVWLTAAVPPEFLVQQVPQG